MPKKSSGMRIIRADLDGVTLALIDIQEVEPFIRKRVEQAIRRTGMVQLLGPVLEDLDRVCAATDLAKSQVNAAIGKIEGQ